MFSVCAVQCGCHYLPVVPENVVVRTKKLKFEMFHVSSALVTVWTVQLQSVCQHQDLTCKIVLCENQNSCEGVKRPISGPATQCMSNQQSLLNERSETGNEMTLRGWNYRDLLKQFVSDDDNVLTFRAFSGEQAPGQAPFFSQSFVTCKLLRGRLWSVLHVSK